MSTTATAIKATIVGWDRYGSLVKYEHPHGAGPISAAVAKVEAMGWDIKNIDIWR